VYPSKEGKGNWGIKLPFLTLTSAPSKECEKKPEIMGIKPSSNEEIGAQEK